jgi:hypothetical protein
MTDVSEMRTAFIITALMIKAVNSSETSVNLNEKTLRNIPEDCHLKAGSRETSANKT